MKPIILSSILALLFYSCKNAGISQAISGKYEKKAKDYQYFLTLNSDSTFTLLQKYFEVNSGCKGKWKILPDNIILLSCDEEKFPAQVESGYMPERLKRVFVINKRKVKIDQVIMLRVR